MVPSITMVVPAKPSTPVPRDEAGMRVNGRGSRRASLGAVVEDDSLHRVRVEFVGLRWGQFLASGFLAGHATAGAPVSARHWAQLLDVSARRAGGVWQSTIAS